MFSRLSSFLPLQRFQNLYRVVAQDLDWRVSTEPPKSIVEAAGDKDFWEAHYTTVIEELSDALNGGTTLQKTLSQLKERLIECQGLVGRYTLSPECYEKGIQSLIEIIVKREQTEDDIYIAMLEEIQQNFVQALREQGDFTRECFTGDLDCLLQQWTEQTISVSDLKKGIAYYSNVMETSDYYDELMGFERHLQANPPFHAIAKEVQQLLVKIDPVKIVESRQRIRTRVIEEEALANSNMQAQMRAAIVDASAEPSLLTRSLHSASGMVN